MPRPAAWRPGSVAPAPRVATLPLPGLLQLREVEGRGVPAAAVRLPVRRLCRRVGVTRGGGLPGSRGWCHSRQSCLEQLDAVRERLALQIRLRPRHLDQRELERQPRIAALPEVVERDSEQVDQPQHGRLGQLVRLLAQPVAGLLRDGEGVGGIADVLDEQEVSQVVEQVGDEPPEVLALLGELLDLHEHARGVPVDDRVAEPVERLLLDGPDQLQHCLRRDLPGRRRRELVERGDCVPE